MGQMQVKYLSVIFSAVVDIFLHTFKSSKNTGVVVK
jgi:hypothetical protein